MTGVRNLPSRFIALILFVKVRLGLATLQQTRQNPPPQRLFLFFIKRLIYHCTNFGPNSLFIYNVKFNTTVLKFTFMDPVYKSTSFTKVELIFHSRTSLSSPTTLVDRVRNLSLVKFKHFVIIDGKIFSTRQEQISLFSSRTRKFFS